MANANANWNELMGFLTLPASIEYVIRPWMFVSIIPTSTFTRFTILIVSLSFLFIYLSTFCCLHSIRIIRYVLVVEFMFNQLNLVSDDI